jgi:hypothetical protein
LLFDLSPFSAAFSRQYYPLEVGNRWDYRRSYQRPPFSGPWTVDSFSVTVKQITTLQNGKTYFELSRSDLAEERFVRVNGNSIFYYSERHNTDVLMFKLDASVGDSWYTPGGFIQLLRVDTSIYFAHPIRVFTYLRSNGGLSSSLKIGGGFGLLEYYDEGEPALTSVTRITLVGGLISSSAFGNPIVTVEPPQRPTSAFVLDQNYPNPFNSGTVIRFMIPHVSPVQFTVFDQLGRSVFFLPEMTLTAGSHSIYWQSHALPSGIYYYRLHTEEGSQTRRMTILK